MSYSWHAVTSALPAPSSRLVRGATAVPHAAPPSPYALSRREFTLPEGQGPTGGVGLLKVSAHLLAALRP